MSVTTLIFDFSAPKGSVSYKCITEYFHQIFGLYDLPFCTEQEQDGQTDSTNA